MPGDEISTAADLYGLPLDRFTEARDLLVRRLRTEGKDEAAETVARLRKPSVVAWALNRAARSRAELVEQLVASHRTLRESKSKETMHEASQMRSRAVADLTEAAMALLEAEGRAGSGQTRDRINRTLLAVATDREGEADLVAGTLVREIEPSGGGWGDVPLRSPAAPSPAARARDEAEKARARAAKLESEAADAKRRVDALETALTEARGRATQARRAAVEAAELAARAEKAARGEEA